jgi:hypothetical protein
VEKIKRGNGSNDQEITYRGRIAHLCSRCGSHYSRNFDFLLVVFHAQVNSGKNYAMNEEDIVYRLRKRAEIRRQIPSRKSVLEGQPDRIADLLEEAANEIESLRST